MMETLFNPAVYNRGRTEGKIEGEINGKTEDIIGFLSELDDYTANIQSIITNKNPDIETLKNGSNMPRERKA